MLDPILIPIIGVTIPIVVVPANLITKYHLAKRGFEHDERMKALEVGRTLPQDEPWWSPPKLCALMGAGVPASVFVAAWMASESVGFHEAIWKAAGMTGMAGVICATILTSKQLGSCARSRNRAGSAFAKPPFDPDAYDVAGRRG